MMCRILLIALLVLTVFGCASKPQPTAIATKIVQCPVVPVPGYCPEVQSLGDFLASTDRPSLMKVFRHFINVYRAHRNCKQHRDALLEQIAKCSEYD